MPRDFLPFLFQPPRRNVRVIPVIPVAERYIVGEARYMVEQETDIDAPIADLQEQETAAETNIEAPTQIANLVGAPQPALACSKTSLRILKVIMIPVLAGYSSLSVSMFIMVLQNLRPASFSKRQQVLVSLLPYSIAVYARTWLLANNVGHRLNGQNDESIPVPDETFFHDLSHVLIALIANTPSFTTGFLIGFRISKNTFLGWQLAVSIIWGSTNFLTNLLTEIASAFRKHTEEIQRTNGENILPFFKQRGMNGYYFTQARRYSIVLRELYPIADGLLHTQAFVEMTNALLPSNMLAIRVFFALLIYCSTAYTARFNLIQLRDNLRAADEDHHLVIDNTLTQSSSLPLRLIGKTISGQLLTDGLNVIVSPQASINITLVFYALGLAIQLIKNFQEAVGSTNQKAVEAGKEGRIIHDLLGGGEGMQQSYAIALIMTAQYIAIILAMIDTYAKAAMLHQQDGEISYQNQVVPVINEDAEDPDMTQIHRRL